MIKYLHELHARVLFFSTKNEHRIKFDIKFDNPLRRPCDVALKSQNNIFKCNGNSIDLERHVIRSMPKVFNKKG